MFERTKRIIDITIDKYYAIFVCLIVCGILFGYSLLYHANFDFKTFMSAYSFYFLLLFWIIFIIISCIFMFYFEQYLLFEMKSTFLVFVGLNILALSSAIFFGYIITSTIFMIILLVYILFMWLIEGLYSNLLGKVLPWILIVGSIISIKYTLFICYAKDWGRYLDKTFKYDWELLVYTRWNTFRYKYMTNDCDDLKIKRWIIHKRKKVIKNGKTENKR